MVVFSCVVEGIIDEAVAIRLVSEVGGTCGAIYGKRGKFYINDRVRRFNNAASRSAWFVLRDFDSDAVCPGHLARELLPQPAEFMCFRLAVREVEAWLLADKPRLARFLGVPQSLLPTDPETLNDPKLEMVNLAGASNKRTIRSGLVPTSGSGRDVGVLYHSELSLFALDAANGWRPKEAAETSPSLARCLARLEETMGRYALAFC